MSCPYATANDGHYTPPEKRIAIQNDTGPMAYSCCMGVGPRVGAQHTRALF
jgi:hypothetical protein